MARIPDEELARLKREADLVALVQAAGVELKPCGADFVGLCPFHEEKTASFHVTPHGPEGLPLWHCFGCGRGGSAVDFLVISQGVSTRQAIELLLVRDLRLTPASARVKKSTVPHLPLPVALDADDQRLLNDVVAFYHETLKGPAGEPARHYLESRGLASSEMIDRFKLGYANRTLGYRLPRPNRRNAGEVRRRLKAIGIFREKTGAEHLNGCVVFPVLAPETRDVLTVYGRKIRDDLPEGCATHLYLKGPHRGVWNADGLSGSKEAVITEGIIDALTFWVNGYRNVVAAYGVNGVIEDHFRAFEQHEIKKVFIAFDRDDAGDRAAEALASRLAEAGIDVYRILFPRTKDQKDANAYAKKVDAPAEALGTLLRSAQFMAKGKGSSVDAPSSACAKSSPSAGAAPPPVEPLPNPSPAPEPLPLAAAPIEDPSTPVLSVAGDEVTMTAGDRVYRVVDLWRNPSLAHIEVNLRASVGEKYHLDALDLARARARENYIAQAAAEMAVEPEVVKKDLAHLLNKLEELLHARAKRSSDAKPRSVEIPEDQKVKAFGLLRDPRLPQRIIEDFERIGLVGEPDNCLVAYLTCVSRKMEDPLASLIQSNSAAGKSALMDAVLSMMPEEDVERYTAVTGQALYYMGDIDLKHRILAIAEVAGATRAGYAIKCLQSDGRISIATTTKDPETGVMTTKRHSVEGPVAIMLTTTEADIDEELQNRAIVLTVNEDREQTRAIHEAQRHAQTLAGMLARRKREEILRLHQNAQRLLRPLLVVNPFADDLTFLDTKLRTRRDHMKYLALIRAVTLLHQYQRPVRHAPQDGKLVPYIEVTLQDIELATVLADAVFGRSLDDLAPQTRRLLELLDEMVTSRCAERKVAREDLRFSRREVREHTKWGVTQTRVHLERLVDLEFLLVHRGARGQSFVYELVYDGKGKDGKPTLTGLPDIQALRRRYAPKLAGQKGKLAAP